MKASGDVQARRAGVHPKSTVGRPPRPPRWRWAVPRDDLKRLLGQGLGPSEIARRYGLNHSTVSRAIRALEHQDLVAVVLGNRCQPSLPQIPPPTVDAPVDVMGEVMGVIEDIRAMRLWLASDEARATLGTPARLGYTLALFDKRLRWAETFLNARSKLLDLISVDVWMTEMLEMLAEEGGPHLKERMMERIRERIFGRRIVRLAPGEPSDNASAEGDQDQHPGT
jgi:IclR-like helix-turn-helix domain-containing protein